MPDKSERYQIHTKLQVKSSHVNKQSDFLNEQTFFQRRHTNPQQVHEKVLNITNC